MKRKPKPTLPTGMTLKPITKFDKNINVYWKCSYKGVTYRLRDRMMIDHLERKVGRRFQEWLRVINEDMAIVEILKHAGEV